MKFLIITGLSGAGKSYALRIMENVNYYCVDNMPPALLGAFASVCSQSSGKIENVALVTDLRSGDMFGSLFSALSELQELGFDYDILFLDSSNETLVKRYKQTRRTHPLSPEGSILDGIKREREMLSEVRSKAKYIINTSDLLPSALRNEILGIFMHDKAGMGIVINTISFGFKYGIPLDADLVFDVRFLPNPFYIPELKPLTGMNKEVSDYVYSFPQTLEFEKRLHEMIQFLIPHYIEEGKNQLVIAIGCTGGCHRSVAITEKLYAFLLSLDHRVVLHHRDHTKDQ